MLHTVAALPVDGLFDNPHFGFDGDDPGLTQLKWAAFALAALGQLRELNPAGGTLGSWLPATARTGNIGHRTFTHTISAVSIAVRIPLLDVARVAGPVLLPCGREGSATCMPWSHEEAGDSGRSDGQVVLLPTVAGTDSR
jgi:hypothetical protein